MHFYEEFGDSDLIAGAHNNIGSLYHNTANYPMALNHFQRSLKLREGVSNPAGTADATMNVGTLYWSTGDSDTALEHYNRALDVYEQIGNKRGVARVTNMKGMAFLAKGDLQDAVEHFNSSLKMLEELGGQSGESDVLGNLIWVMFETGDYDAARDLLQRQAEVLTNSPKDRAGHHTYKSRLAEVNGDLERRP